MPTKLELGELYTKFMNNLNDLIVLLHDIEGEIETLQEGLKDYMREELGKDLTKNSQKT